MVFSCFQFFDTTYSTAVHFLLFFANGRVRNCLTVELPGHGSTRFIFYYILPTVLQRGNIWSDIFPPTDLPKHFIKNLSHQFWKVLSHYGFHLQFSSFEWSWMPCHSELFITIVCFSTGSLMLLICKSSLYMEEISCLFSDKLPIFSHG